MDVTESADELLNLFILIYFHVFIYAFLWRHTHQDKQADLNRTSGVDLSS